MRRFTAFICASTIGWGAAVARAQSTATVSGIVISTGGGSIDGAIVELRGRGAAPPSIAITDAIGEFRISSIAPGRYTLTARRLGYVTTTRDTMLAPDETLRLTLRMTPLVAELKPVTVSENPLAIDVTSTEFAKRISTGIATLLPTGRDAASLVELVPGATRQMMWGGAGVLANSYRLDGLSLAHPGFGGDLVGPAIDWVEAVEVSGLGAGASLGDFQGGVVNAITKSGSNSRRTRASLFVDSRALAGENKNLLEEGVEQDARRELIVETSGPLKRDRLFYFVSGQAVQTGYRLPNLLTLNERDYRSQRIEAAERRGFGKLSWSPSTGTRLEALGVIAGTLTDHAGLTGFDQETASRRDDALSSAFEVALTKSSAKAGAVDLRVGGVVGSEQLESYGGQDLPGVRIYQAGIEPAFQNAEFTESNHPSVYSAKARWIPGTIGTLVQHHLEVGAEASLSYWRQERIRNGGVTWRPYPSATLDPANAATWRGVASDWGGGIYLDSRMSSASVFAEDRIRVGRRLTLTPGARLSQWTGGLDPVGAPSYTAVATTAIDPRVGAVFDPTGTNRLVLKAHWGIYHQGMAAALFDRVGAAAPYQDERLYFEAPAGLSSGTTPWTDAQRDQLFVLPNGRPLQSVTRVRSEAGRLEGYRQPYVEELVGGAEYTLGTHWHIEAAFVDRKNRDFVGLVDRNLATNYTVLHDVGLGFYPTGLVAREEGVPLTLPTVYVRNDDVRSLLQFLQSLNAPAPAQLPYALLSTLAYEPDLVFTTIPEARRRMRQMHLTLSASYGDVYGLASLTATSLRGNVSGVTTLGGVGSSATAGQWVRPNEAVNSFGDLGGFSPIEAMVWMTGKFDEKWQGGFTVTHLMGEFTSNDFEIEVGRYRLLEPGPFAKSYDNELFAHVIGQTILIEPPGSHHYADRTQVDVRLERKTQWRGSNIVLTADVTNLLGSDETTLVQTRVNAAWVSGQLTRLGTSRLRMPPRMLRIGSRIELDRP